MNYTEDFKNAQNGSYLCYVSPKIDISPNADRMMLTLYNGGWFYPMADVKYRDTVYGAWGPVPPMQLTK